MPINKDSLEALFSQLELRLEEMPGIDKASSNFYVVKSASGKDIGTLDVDQGKLEYYERYFAEDAKEVGRAFARKYKIELGVEYSQVLTRLELKLLKRDGS
jgi:hypothetical protein